MTADEVTQLIEAGLPGAQVRVQTDDDTHFEAVVVAPQFEGKRPLQRHQLVYAGARERAWAARSTRCRSRPTRPAEWQARAGRPGGA